MAEGQQNRANANQPQFPCHSTESAFDGPEAIRIEVRGPVLKKKPYHYVLTVEMDGVITLRQEHDNTTRSKRVSRDEVQKALNELAKTGFFREQCCYPVVLDGGSTRVSARNGAVRKSCSENNWPANHLKKAIDRVLAALDINGWVQWPH